MCGRLNIVGTSLNDSVGRIINREFCAADNSNVTPGSTVSILGNIHGHLRQVNTKWGIRPDWAKKLIVNAESETANVKQTFRLSFHSRRCVVPCSAWFEWSKVDGKRKKYTFQGERKQPLYMAGLWFEYLDKQAELVTLTTKSSGQCARYHRRMPLLIRPEDIMPWIMLPASRVGSLLERSCQPLSVTAVV